MMIWFFAAVFALVVAAAIWVRVAPFDVAFWHVDPVSAVETKKGSFKTELDLPGVASVAEALDRVKTVAAGWPRTSILFGDSASGRISFVTRTKLWGFPDVTTVEASSGQGGVHLSIFARQRFGQDDGGVNRARVKAWVKQLNEN